MLLKQQNFWMTTNQNVSYKVISNCFKHHRSNSGSFHSLNVSGVESESLTVSDLRKQTKVFCCFHKFLIERAREIKKFSIDGKELLNTLSGIIFTGTKA